MPPLGMGIDDLLYGRVEPAKPYTVVFTYSDFSHRVEPYTAVGIYELFKGLGHDREVWHDMRQVVRMKGVIGPVTVAEWVQDRDVEYMSEPAM